MAAMPPPVPSRSVSASRAHIIRSSTRRTSKRSWSVRALATSWWARSKARAASRSASSPAPPEESTPPTKRTPLACVSSVLVMGVSLAERPPTRTSRTGVPRRGR